MAPVAAVSPLGAAALAAGTALGESTTGMLVNSSEKLDTSMVEVILGMNGAGMFFLNRSSQLMVEKNL